MSKKSGSNRHEGPAYEQAAVQFLNSNGRSVDQAASELGVDPSDLLIWKKKYTMPNKTTKSLSGMARLRAENEALRTQILNLQVQWDILKTTLGVLSTTVCSRETV
jgi:transposase-like protein